MGCRDALACDEMDWRGRVLSADDVLYVGGSIGHQARKQQYQLTSGSGSTN